MATENVIVAMVKAGGDRQVKFPLISKNRKDDRLLFISRPQNRNVTRKFAC